jgi:hypothetical protein
LTACSSTPSIPQPVPPVEVRTVQAQRPAPIVPPVDQLRLRQITWKIITPENVEDVFSSLSGDVVLFALTSDGYEALSLNISDIRGLVEQQQRIIAIYQSSFR